MTESELFPVVETTHGRVRGLVSGGIQVFKGLRYGADTSGANRYLPPQPVVPWSGVRDAIGYGNHAPQMPVNRNSPYADLILYDVQPGGMGEDCLVLNVWTPGTGSRSDRPVMVHLHGGAYYGGSGNSPQFDGEMLARHGDAVVVTVNHRLGSFGFLDLSELGGERYAASGASGMLDLVAALQWVRDNIAAFGGDPSRVLVFGQSGGGAKTGVLMAMPSARGLFHRAGVMSGSSPRLTSRDAATAQARVFCDLLGVTAASIDKLHTLPFHQLLAAQATMEEAERARGEAPASFTPVLDGVVLPHHPFAPAAFALSADVPLVIGTVLDERAYRKVNFNLDDAGLLRFAEAAAPGDGERLVAMYRDEDPHASPYLLQCRIDTDVTFRRWAHVHAERKAAVGAAAAYAYLWKIPSAAWGGRFGAPHGVDIGPSLHDIRHGLNGPTRENLKLADQLASAWVAFAATGNPNNPATPAWGAYTLPARTTLVFDVDSQHTASHDDPRAAFRTQWTLG